jgi:type IV secretion system protein VirB6
MHPITEITARVDSLVGQYITDTVVTLSAALNPVVTAALTLYVIAWGFALLRGATPVPAMDAMFRMFWITVICMVALTVGSYNDVIRDFFWVDLPVFLQDAIAGTNSASSSALDDILNRGMTAGLDIWDHADWTDIPALLIGALCIVATLLVVGLGAVIQLVAKLTLGILIALGPLFLVMWIFELTRKFADLWITQVINYILVSGLVVVVASFVVTLFEDYLSQMLANSATSGVPDGTGAIIMTLVAIIGVAMMTQVTRLASALSGGIALAVREVTSPLERGARASGRYASLGASSTAGYGLGRAVRSIAGQGDQLALPAPTPMTGSAIGLPSPGSAAASPGLARRTAQRLQGWDGQGARMGFGPSWRRGVNYKPKNPYKS